jgi:MFS family permease
LRSGRSGCGCGDESKTKRKGFSPLSLDAVNFLAADVRGAVGPYLNVFLVTQQDWSQSEVGFVTTIGGLVGIAVQTPIGAAIDETRAKRGVIVLALAVLAVTAVVIFAYPTFWPVAVANSVMAVAGDVFGPTVAALTLGLFARPLLARRMGRNAAFDHAGNVARTASASGLSESPINAKICLTPICSSTLTTTSATVWDIGLKNRGLSSRTKFISDVSDGNPSTARKP